MIFELANNPNKKLKILRLSLGQAGFSLLEITAVLGVIITGLLGVSSLVAQNIQAQYVNRNSLIASMLAQEGLELVRNIRDENWITQPAMPWNTDITDGDGTFIMDYNGRTSIDDFVDDLDDAGARLYFDANDYYAHGGAVQTPFFRLISVMDNGDYLAVSSTVRWKERGRTHDYVAETYFYNWR